MPLPEEKKHYTYADYLEWDGDERIELINGEIYRIAGPSPEQKKPYYTYADYLEWDNCDFIELIQGKTFVIKSQPLSHHDASNNLRFKLMDLLENSKTYEVYSAPVTVCLFEKVGDDPQSINTVVQPDIFIVSHEQIDKYSCIGAPVFIAEIISLSTASHDCFVKFNLYLQAGVREYWIVDPESRSVHVYLLENGKFQLAQTYSRNDIAKVTVLEGCFIELSKVFPEKN